jgi:hypothetical protein
MRTLLLAILMTLSGMADAKAKDTCSMINALCEAQCWREIALANLQCRKQCKEQFASCLKTGAFRTREMNRSGLEKQ